MNASAKGMIRIELVENLDEVVIAVAFVEEKRKIDCSDKLELFSEVLVLTLHIIGGENKDLLITEEESIVIQTKLANCNDLFHLLSLLCKRDQLCND